MVFTGFTVAGGLKGQVRFDRRQKQRREVYKEEPLHEILPVLFRLRFVLYLILAFSAGCLVIGLFFSRQGSDRIRALDTRYATELSGTAETIGQLTAELGRERGINRKPVSSWTMSR
jgi:hypothetical protein